jgi:hypothetical protein
VLLLPYSYLLILLLLIVLSLTLLIVLSLTLLIVLSLTLLILSLPPLNALRACGRTGGGARGVPAGEAYGVDL